MNKQEQVEEAGNSVSGGSQSVGHKELVRRAGKWLKERHGVVCMEIVSYAPEVPDAVGFAHHRSTVIECKASRADFLRDKKKWHRSSTTGMGNLRFYLCPPDVIRVDELPEKWGLLYWHPRSIEVVRNAEHLPSDTYALMYSLLRRAVVRGFNPNDRIITGPTPAPAPAPSNSEKEASSTTSHQTENPSPSSSTKTEGEE